MMRRPSGAPRIRSRVLATFLAGACIASACTTTPAEPSASEVIGPGAVPTDTTTTSLPEELPLVDRSGPYTLTVGNAAVAESVDFALDAPEFAFEVQVATDPSFVNAEWLPIETLTLNTPSTGVQELFVRYRNSRNEPVGDVFVSAFTLLGPLTPLTGDDIDPSRFRVTRVAPDVVQIDVEIGEVESTENGPTFIPGPDLRPDRWTLGDIELRIDDDTIPVDELAVISEPTGHVDTDHFSMAYRLHLRTAEPLPVGIAHLTLADIDGVRGEIDDRSWSPAVRVNQLGWGTTDPKKAHVSVWTTLSEPIAVDDLRAEVVDDDDTTVLTVGGVAFEPDDRAELWRGDLTGGPTSTFDLSAVRQPGAYRICVDGIGCSHRFEITDAGPWAPTMATVSRALFHQRSGIELGLPHTAFERPRSHHPDDGWVAIDSTQTLYADANGRGEGPAFVDLIDGSTGQPVPDAWGGHFDAGDWDRRIQHLWMARRLIDLVDEFDNLAALDLQIPESGDAVPDLLDEALWTIDAYRRMQRDDGAVRGGLESAEHPLDDTTSWTDPLDLFAYAPDAWSSWTYAAVAADAAVVLDDYDPDRAQDLAQSAIAAGTWAEDELAAGRVDRSSDEDLDVQRATAGISLYRLTEDERWHDVFEQSSELPGNTTPLACVLSSSCESAWRYATLPDHLGDASTRQNAVDSIVSGADRLLMGAETTAFGWVMESLDVGIFYGLGPSNPHGVTLMRAYLLTDDDRYRDQVVSNASFSLGANPTGATWLTGVGFDNPDRIQGADQINGGIPVWPGTPLYGAFTPWQLPDWYLTWYLRESEMTPDPLAWPTLHSFVDLGLFAGQSEFTIHQSHGEAIWTYGALAGTASS